jgi:hypothetical protein
MKSAFSILFAFLAFSLNAQDIQKHNKFGFAFDYNVAEFIYFQGIEGAAGVESQPSLSCGISYAQTISLKMNILFGLQYQVVKSEITPAPTGEPQDTHYVKSHWIESPVLIQSYLSKRFYLKYGIDMIAQGFRSAYGPDNQSGLGLIGGFGIDIAISKKLQLELEPGLKVLSLFPFTHSGYQEHFVATTLGLKVYYLR